MGKVISVLFLLSISRFAIANNDNANQVFIRVSGKSGMDFFANRKLSICRLNLELNSSLLLKPSTYMVNNGVEIKSHGGSMLLDGKGVLSRLFCLEFTKESVYGL